MALCRTQMRQALRRSAGNLLGSGPLELCLDKENAGASKVFLKNFEIMSTEILSPCKNSFGKTIGQLLSKPPWPQSVRPRVSSLHGQ
jgi:hypothetical protein